MFHGVASYLGTRLGKAPPAYGNEALCECATCSKKLQLLLRSVTTGPEAVRFLRAVSTVCSDDTDRLVDTVTDLYRQASLPEARLRIFSVLQQQFQRQGNANEYATTTLWMCAVQSVIERGDLERLARREVRKWHALSCRPSSCPAAMCYMGSHNS